MLIINNLFNKSHQYLSKRERESDSREIEKERGEKERGERQRQIHRHTVTQERE